MARFFKKLNTHVKETIEDDFIDPFDEKKSGENVSLKLKSTFKTPSGWMIKAEGSTHANGNTVEGTIEPEYKVSGYDITVKGKFQTNNAFELSLLFNNLLGSGATLFLTDKISENKEKSFEGGIDYLSKDVGSLNVKVTTPSDFETSKIDVYTALVGFYNGYSLGGDCKVNLKNFLLPINGNAYLEYNKKDLSVVLFGKYEDKNGKKKQTIGVGYHQNINDNIRSAVDYSFEQVSSRSDLRFGTSYKFDENCSLKTRLLLRGKKEMRLGLVLKQNLFPSTRLTFTTDLDTRALLDNVSEDPGHQFGVTLSFFD